MKKSILARISLMIIFPILLLGMVVFFSSCSTRPIEPKNKYGEFPFKLVYEKNDGRIEIIDSFVIEYLGVGYDEGRGKHNKWRAYYKSAKTDPTHSISDTDLVLFNDYVDGVGSVKIFFALGSCEYYMGLEETGTIYQWENISPGDIVITSREGTRSISNEELLQDYGINIIEKTISSPIS